MDVLPPSEYIESLLVHAGRFTQAQDWLESYHVVLGDRVRVQIEQVARERYEELCAVFPEQEAKKQLLLDADKIVSSAFQGIDVLVQDKLVSIASEHIRAAPDLLGRLSRYRAMMEGLRAARRGWSVENQQPCGYTNVFLLQLQKGLRFAVIEPADVDD